ncbi:hypothetical protein [Falsiruegeria litorea]|uniref:hypothetical protein n=1 Tax=Falsiruegeria litorea TaxID=1280831 RepID=UPI001BFD5E39|nr:hypothetical protein [Falsiruegeria litorea]MBT8167589.1 hypothetical protein [Falsiruegeria litorea]
MPPHLDKYRKHLAPYKLGEAREDEIIHMVHNAMDSFVSRNFDDDPTQVCIEGQVVKNALPDSTVLDSAGQADATRSLSETFNATKGKR